MMPQTTSNINSNLPSSHAYAQYVDIFETLSPIELMITRHIVYFASKSWGYCKKTYADIAKENNVSYITVFRLIQKLKKGLIRCYRMANQASKIYVTDELVDYFKRSKKPNDSSMIVPTILKRNKDRLDDSLDTTSSFESQEEAVKPVKQQLREYGLDVGEVFKVDAMVKKAEMTPELVRESILATGARKVGGAIKNKAAYLWSVLKSKSKEVELATEEVKRYTDISDLTYEEKKNIESEALLLTEKELTESGWTFDKIGYSDAYLNTLEKHTRHLLSKKRD